MPETGEPGQFLPALFLQRFGARAAAELQIFLEQVQQVDLPFGDLTAQMRQQEYPGYPGFECGLPPRFYYFVPGTTYGGHKPAPADPLDLSFVSSVDGLGLNFGCPLRLRRALAALLSLPPEQQREARKGLSADTKHLATVEELIWAGVWKPPFTIERPMAGQGKSHDWRVLLLGLTLNVECKFRPANWAKLVDGEAFNLMRGSLAREAACQLPKPAPPGSLDVVAVTGLAPVDGGFRRLCWSELNAYPSVGVIVYATIVGQISVFSRSSSLAERVQRRIEPWPADEFGGFATITTFRPENARRAEARRGHPTVAEAKSPSGLVELRVRHPPARKLLDRPPPEYPYRRELERRLDSGEPIFRMVPPFLPA